MPKNDTLENPFCKSLGATQQTIVLWMFLMLIVLPQCLFSSQEWIAGPRLIGLFGIALTAGAIDPRKWGGWDRWGICFLMTTAVAYAASAAGGMLNAQPRALGDSIRGIFSIAGFAILVGVLLEPRWRVLIKRLALSILVTLLVSSLVAYFIPIQRYIAMGETTAYFETTRLALIWPSRIAMAWAGQIGWEHTNYAGLIFAISLISIFNFIAAKDEKILWKWWLLTIGLGIAIFLTGSRTALLMILVSLPFLLFRRPFQFVLTTVLSLGLAFGLGMATLKFKEASLVPATSSVAEKSDLHVGGIVKRGSSGRLSAYEILWKDLEGSRLLGKGLSSTDQPVAQLRNEHSSYLATLRGGGLIALAAHGFILLNSLLAAALLYVKNIRYPLILLIATSAAILFDHSSVFVASGRYDFILHWTAVLLPLFLIARLKPAPPTKPSARVPRSGTASAISR